MTTLSESELYKIPITNSSRLLNRLSCVSDLIWYQFINIERNALVGCWYHADSYIYLHFRISLR